MFALAGGTPIIPAANSFRSLSSRGGSGAYCVTENTTAREARGAIIAVSPVFLLCPNWAKGLTFLLDAPRQYDKLIRVRFGNTGKNMSKDRVQNPGLPHTISVPRLKQALK